ncbi:DUF6468 domain-containing protein [Roseibium salinum]|uniref:DUF6468 domain-containing protein n=1 Tax=Roseibium salinum TaxID=1604349 RepID=A0ABT3QYZ6_9HYPH|nr:DUF6468 domain-containing protein [Roseibium sp. DSM 29163]MCX2722063.1 DUF6468 domain-containing protein [Roseibium sp. DSM 29163]MDN3719928.1 DUF6468 domain-containing protein [Roseibium salinum]
MTTLPLGMIIEGLVAILLLITIGYCWILNRRLQRLRADEQVLRATIAELMTATEIAERAILGLKTTAAEADRTLGSRLKQAETMSQTLSEQVSEGEKIFTRITQIAEAARAATPQRQAAPREEAYAVQPPSEAPVYGHQPHAYAPSGAYGGQAAGEPERKRSTRASDICNAAAEATARLEEFRRRKGAAA